MTLEACVAFGSASLAVFEVLELHEQDRLEGPRAADLLAELVVSHDRLLRLFAAEDDDEVCGLALSLLVLVDRLTGSYE